MDSVCSGVVLNREAHVHDDDHDADGEEDGQDVDHLAQRHVAGGRAQHTDDGADNRVASAHAAYLALLVVVLAVPGVLALGRGILNCPRAAGTRPASSGAEGVGRSHEVPAAEAGALHALRGVVHEILHAAGCVQERLGEQLHEVVVAAEEG